MENELKTGTTTLGLVCKDGIVLASDRRATAGYFIAAKNFKKIVKINDDIAVTVAGSVSDVQLLIKLLRSELNLKQMQTRKQNTVNEASNLLRSFIFNYIRYSSAFILAGKDIEGFHINEITDDGCVINIDDYISTGSGSLYVYGILEEYYKKGMPVKEGVNLAIRCINSAMSRDIGSGNGIDVFTITKEGIKKVFEKEINLNL